MNLTYKKSESTAYPQLIDTTSSKTTVYIRRNVVEKKRTDEITGDTYIYYEYEEVKVPKIEYEKYLCDKVRADVDYIAFMAGIELWDGYE